MLPDSDQDPSTMQLLGRFRSGDSEAASKLVSIFYNELRRIAAAHMRGEEPGHTLQPTALVNEVYFKMVQKKASPTDTEKSENTESDFFRLARYLMAQILIEHARRKRALKRRHIKVELDEAWTAEAQSNEHFPAILAALDRLEMQDPDLRRIVDLRFFCGYSIAETARSLAIGQTKVKADWRLAKLWLQRELSLMEGVDEEAPEE